MSFRRNMPGSTTTFTTFRTTASKAGTAFIPRTARGMPTGTKLPGSWRKDMDRFICQCDALGDVDIRTIVRGLKKKFKTELGHVAVSCDAVQRRIMALDLQENDYFVKGMQTAVKKVEAAGFVLPPMDFEKYVRKEEGLPELLSEEPQEATEPSSAPPAGFTKTTPSTAPSVGRVRLVDSTNEDSLGSIKEHDVDKVLDAHQKEECRTHSQLMKNQENRDYVIPIKRMEGLPASGTSALLARRAGLKDSGSVASLAYSSNSAATTSFDAVGRTSPLPRSTSLQQGHSRKSSGGLLPSAILVSEPSPTAPGPLT